MKKFLAFLIVGLTLLTIPSLSVKAASSYNFKNDSGINEVAPGLGYEVNSELPVEYYIGTILSVLFSLLGLVFFILIIYAGINWMTAQGNEAQVTKAKEIISKAIVGLIICLLAYALTFFVMNALQKTPQARTSITK